MNRKDKAITPNYYDKEFNKLVLHKFTQEQQITISEFNAFKYLYRWKEKNGVQDLKKAIWYIKDIVKKLESQEKAEKELESALNKQKSEKYKNCIYTRRTKARLYQNTLINNMESTVVDFCKCFS